MAWKPWLKERLAQADLVNLGVIVVFALFLGAGGVAAMQKNADVAPAEPLAPEAVDKDDEAKDDDANDDRRDRGKGGGNGKDDDKDDDDDDDDD